MRYEDKLQAWRKRKVEIMRLYKKGKTFREIAKVFKISAERVRSIYIKKYNPPKNT